MGGEAGDTAGDHAGVARTANPMYQDDGPRCVHLVPRVRARSSSRTYCTHGRARGS